jgi:peptidyl-dipeptidase Dcp
VPGDLGYVTYLHGTLYAAEYGYGIPFESYVAAGLNEFYISFNRAKDRVWVCESGGRIVGFLLLMHRGHGSAQLRYFLIAPEFRRIGLGKRLMAAYMDALKECGYRHSYLWTTHELTAAASLYRRHGFVLTEEHESDKFGKSLREQRYDYTMP